MVKKNKKINEIINLNIKKALNEIYENQNNGSEIYFKRLNELESIIPDYLNKISSEITRSVQETRQVVSLIYKSLSEEFSNIITNVVFEDNAVVSGGDIQIVFYTSIDASDDKTALELDDKVSQFMEQFERKYSAFEPRAYVDDYQNKLDIVVIVNQLPISGEINNFEEIIDDIIRRFNINS